MCNEVPSNTFVQFRCWADWKVKWRGLLIAVDGTLINLTQLQLWFPVLLQT